MIQTEISIDRLTVVAYDTGTITDYLKENGKNSGYIARENFSRNYGFKHAYHLQNGELLEVGDKGRVRLDFNPNKTNREQIEDIFSRLKYPHLTRLDIAIDYFDKDLSSLEWTDSKRRKRNYWVDGFGALETLYIGAPSSHKRFRIYNKLKEREENGHGEWEKDWKIPEIEKKKNCKQWWRVEVQKRFKESDNILDPKEYFLTDLFDISPVLKHIDLSHIEKTMDRLAVIALLERPEELKNISKNIRPKYKKMIEEAREKSGKVLDKEPQEVYEKEKSHLVEGLNDLFKKCSKLTAFK